VGGGANNTIVNMFFDAIYAFKELQRNYTQYKTKCPYK
jgi:hypothetical protein